jgi:hypothetical protein
MNKKLILLNALIIFSICVTGQLLCDTSSIETKGKEGLLLRPKYSNMIILLRDTCNEANRISNLMFNKQGIYYPLYYKAFLVDSNAATQVQLVVSKICPKAIKKYVQLYVGFLDEQNDTCFLVQFIKTSEFKKNKHYLNQLDLIARRSNDLRFVIFKKKLNKMSFITSFPKNFLQARRFLSRA